MYSLQVSPSELIVILGVLLLFSSGHMFKLLRMRVMSPASTATSAPDAIASPDPLAPSLGHH